MKDNKIETLEDLYDRAYNNALKDAEEALDKGFETLHGGGNARRLLSQTKKVINNLMRNR